MPPEAGILRAVTGALVESTREGYREFNAGDVEALSGRLAADFQWNEAAEIPGRKTCANRDEFVRYMRGFEMLWDEFSFDVSEIEAPSSDVVYAKVRASGRGKTSEEAVEFVIHHVWRLRDGLYSRMDAYLDEDEARAAAGL